jgi:hypothetical protein
VAQRSVAFRFRAAEHEKECLKFLLRVHSPGGGKVLYAELFSRCCGIDVHKDSVTACVLIGSPSKICSSAERVNKNETHGIKV